MLYQVFMEVTNIPGASENLSLYEYDKEDKNKIIEETILPFLKKKNYSLMVIFEFSKCS